MLKISFKDIHNFLRKTFRFGVFIPMSNILPLYFGRIMPKCLKNKMSAIRNLKIKEVIYNNVDCKTSMQYQMRQLDNANIWFFWLQGEDKLPAVPRLCLASIKKYSTGHKVILLDSKNIHDYVELPDFVINLYDEGVLKAAHFADILRVAILYYHGGLWLDSTILLTAPLPEDVFSQPFFTIKTKPFGNFVSQCRWSVFCLGGHKGNPIFGEVCRMFFEYLQKETVFVDYFMFDQFINILYENNSQIHELINNVPMNNPAVHALTPLLCDKFDQSILDQLKKNTYIFKLSWKKYTDQQLFKEEDSFFAYFYREYNK